MRIMILIRSLELAGAERQAMLLAAGARARGHQVHLVLLKELNELAGPLRDVGVEITPLGSEGPRGMARSVLRLMAVLRRWRPDALYGFMDAPNVLVSTVASATGVRRRVAGVRASDMDPADMPRLARILWRLEPWATRNADVVVVNSRSGAAAAAERGFRTASLTVIENGVDTDFYVRDAHESETLRTALGLPLGLPLLARVGRLHPMKGWEDFLEAVRICRRENPEFGVLAVGSGPQEAELQRRATALGLDDFIRWLPATSDIRQVYSAVDVLVSSSIYGEGMPNVVLEAMSCRVPCVVTDVGDSARVVGDTGLVVPPRRPALLAQAISEVLHDPDRQIRGDRARRRVVEEYALGRMIDRSLDVLAAVGA